MTLEPFPDTWLDTNQEPTTMRQYCKKQMQKCKDEWLTTRKYGTTILKMSEQEVIERCQQLEREWKGWDEDVEELIQKQYEENHQPPPPAVGQLGLFD